MSIADLKFLPYAAKAETVQAAKATEALVVPTAHGPEAVAEGAYVLIVGTAQREHNGPHDDGKGGQVFEPRLVEEPLYEAMSAEDFEAVFAPAKVKAAKSE